MRSRIILLFSGLAIFWSVAILRAGFLQLTPNDKLQSLASRQYKTTVALQARRGAILDRYGKDLALSETTFSLFADPSVIQKKRVLARKLSKELNISFDTILDRVSDSEKRFVWIQRQMSLEQRNRIQDLGLKGLGFIEEAKRVYPNESLLGNVIGFVGREGQGLEGLELSQNDQLTKNRRTLSVRRDARGRPLVVADQLFTEIDEGADLQLTIDMDLQHLLENEIRGAVHDFVADQAFGIVLEAKTSAILAVAMSPGMDPNHPHKTAAEHRRNRIVTDVFEPGSTMKTFAIAAALRENQVTPNKKYNTENGKFQIGRRIIREAEVKHQWPELTVSEILALSSNIGTSKIALEVGAEKLRRTFLDFGFGAKSGVDMPGEARGVVHNLPWNPHLLANISFGQGISVNFLQLANAYAAIANGGVLHQPFVVLAHKETDRVEIARPKPIRRVLTTEQASQMRMMLVGVTGAGGTGGNARVPGFLVGGKTGTAQKPNPLGKGYLPNAYISSFVGFIPAENPEYVILIAVDHPKERSYYGSSVAAPIFSRVASYAVRRQGLSPMLISMQGEGSVK